MSEDADRILIKFNKTVDTPNRISTSIFTLFRDFSRNPFEFTHRLFRTYRTLKQTVSLKTTLFQYKKNSKKNFFYCPPDMPRRHLSEPEVARLATLVEEGHTHRDVAVRMGVNQSVVSRAYARYRETNRLTRRPGQGRHRVTDYRDDRAIVRQVRRDPFVNANVVARNFPNRRQQQQQQGRRNQIGHISARTVRNRLREAGLRARHPNRVPALTARHRRRRLEYANQYRRWTLRQWQNVLFTDESRFNLHGSDRRPLVWRRRGERFGQNFVRPVVAYGGGSVMVWAGVSRNWRPPLVIIRGNLTARRYIDQILRPIVLPRRQNQRAFVLMQDNARPHTANVTRRFFERYDITLLPHPPMSPDLNPIEHVWDIMGRRLQREYPNLGNIGELERALHRIWNTIPQPEITRCINMAERLRAVIESRGGNTRY